MRKLSALFVAALLLVAVAGCSTKKTEDVSASADSTEEQGGEDVSTSTTERPSDTTDSSDDAGSGGGPGGGSLADMVQTCGAVGLVVGTLGLGGAFLSDDQMAELEQQLDELEGEVPAEIEGDVETIRNGAADANSLAELGEFLDSDEYSQAMENISTWVEANCNMDNPFGS